ncbi:hypothetical protein HU824_16105 [Bacteroides sp. L10-4]|uniref:BF3164 family lipoprotein n=1 Tax=Bacteroides sp. L10-4 TaxID=2746063 RepID=UPI0015962EB8|nr:BF3164 family lipoprotein [Bacteroides sp. L10-4]NVK94680.1 hypothetical protein [Bacteroides sp. L10-4]
MKDRILLLLLGTSILFSCSQKERYLDAQSFNFNDFEAEIELKGKTLEFDDLIMNPIGLQVYDSILITLEYGGESLCNIYNLNTKKKIGGRLTKGQGPNEMLMPSFIDNDGESIQIIDMATSTIYNYDLIDFIENANSQPISKIKLAESINSGAQILGDKFIGYPYFKERQLYVFDKEGKKIGEMVDFPRSTIDYSDMERTDAYYMGFATNGSDRVAICYYMTDLIEIYDSVGVLKNSMHGPEHFFSYFKEEHDADGVTSYPVKGKNRDSYFAPRSAGSQLFVLYNGRYVDEKGHDSCCKKLFSFSWDGNPKNVYILDDAIFTFCVDKRKHKIYGVGNSPDNHIVEYSY